MTMTFNESRWPRENAIKVVKGNGVSKLAVFMDPMCVYCKRLSRETLANLDFFEINVEKISNFR